MGRVKQMWMDTDPPKCQECGAYLDEQEGLGHTECKEEA